MRFDPRNVILTVPDDTLDTSGSLKLVVRAADPDSLIGPLWRTVMQVAPHARRLSIMTGSDLIAADMGRERLGAWFFSGFGLVAVILAVGGVFGMVAYLAESRRREFGIRAALGATTSRLARMAIAAGLIPVAVGTCLGLIAAVWLVKAAESFLMGVSWFSPMNYLTAGLMMLVSAALAGIAAAWRIRMIAPSEALRDA
jgi:ABC-type antimicrobial peptide transport system permease subunit